MPIKVGASIKSALPSDQREGIEEYLWSKSGGRCHLCEASLNMASDAIEADHDIPSSADGGTDRDNLWLAHQTCNRAKRDNPSVDVRPYLKLKYFLTENGFVLRYDGVLAHFGIDPKPSKLTDLGDFVQVDLPNGKSVESPVFEDVNREGEHFRYTFLRVPRVALRNDDEVQPRTLKISQVWSIYSDLAKNPLHEPPSCRVIEAGGGMAYFGLFDGQHKTVSTWMTGADEVTVKVYLNLSKDAANYLVNSIQAKIKKLPLSPFELSAKLSEEWSVRLEEYREKVPASEASEAGFIAWLEKGERSRAKSAFEAALIREYIGAANDIGLLKYVHLSGQPKTGDSLITETQFNTRILKTLIHTAPLSERSLAGEECRQREKTNIVEALNLWSDLVFEPDPGAAELTELQAERRRRMVYGGAMSLIAALLKSTYRQVFAVDEERAFLDKTANETTEKQIQESVARLVNHPIWTADFDLSPKTRAFREALLKNQDVAAVASDVGLKLGYVVGADTLPANWQD